MLRKLRQFPAIGLLGPRQVGKTTLALDVASSLGDATYLDLENPTHMARLSDPHAYLSIQKGKLVVIDEVQRMPELFPILRGLIDERIRAGEQTCQFLLLGSASVELLRQSSESLAGRITYMDLPPLDLTETGPDTTNSLWLRGGFPRAWLAEDDSASADWRASFITTYLEHDIPMLAGRLPAETLRRLWTMLAHNQGQLLNASQYARSLAVSSPTVSQYIDLLVDLLMVRRLQPWHANVSKRLVKSPRLYIRDSGLTHSLLGLETLDHLLSHPVAGASWEGFVIETLINLAPARSKPYFYRTASGVEMDLVLHLPGDQLWAFEIKRSTAPKLRRNFNTALDDLKPDRCFVITPGSDQYPVAEKAEVIGIEAMVKHMQESA